MSATASMIRCLLEATDLHALDDKTLQSLCRQEEISLQLENIAKVMEGIGCLVSQESSKGSTRAGSFENPDDLATMLFAFSNSIDDMAQSVSVANEAEFVLHERRHGKARAAA